MELTRLEYAAIHIYQGMIASLDSPKPDDECECEQMAHMAVNGAHILLECIDENQENQRE